MKKRSLKTSAITIIATLLMLFTEVSSFMPVYAKGDDNELCSVNYVVSSSWEGGYCAEVSIQNNTENDLENWELSFLSYDVIVSIWGGTLVSNNIYDEGTDENASDSDNIYKYKIVADQYNNTIAANNSVQIGFLVNGGNQAIWDEKVLFNEQSTNTEDEKGEETSGNDIDNDNVDNDIFHYTMYASSDSDDAITIDANNFCINGNIITNGKLDTNKATNINGTLTENASREMILLNDRIKNDYYSNENVITYKEDSSLDSLNINIFNSVLVKGEVAINGKSNIKGAIAAFGDIIMTGDVSNTSSSIFYSMYGDIIIESQNVDLNGLVYAPYGDVRITASNLNANSVIIIADRIIMDCDNININYNFDMAGFIGNTSDNMSSIPSSCFKYLKDSDGDMLPDAVEIYIGTNKDGKDSDGDGLTDYQEVMDLCIDPLKIDTNDNGISDYDEDQDEDTLSNGSEYIIGTYPMSYDSDYDGLSDAEELTYGTDAMNIDTDGDSAEDAWEITNGYDPLVYDSTFVVYYETSSYVNELNPISASAKVELKEGDVKSLKIKSVSAYDNPKLNPSIAGYLGNAYDFSVDGAFDKATITFSYDSSLGSLSEEFQPRIYYYNEQTGFLEELANQTVTDSSVSVTVEHFSIYILLNKSDYDKVWEEEILPSVGSGNGSGIDVVFVIDSSGSMKWNDVKNQRKDAVKSFIDKLGQNDQAAVVDFESSAYVYQGFTSDHQLLYNAVNKVDSYGGTNLSRGMSAAINLFTDNNYTNTGASKVIIFLTDGDGEYDTAYTTKAENNGIVVFVVGLGSGVITSKLEAIATGTHGKYFHASNANGLGGIYNGISEETIDKEKDSNNDGISDYYSKLIMDGTLRTGVGASNLAGIDLTYGPDGKELCDDWDGDGIKNGDEIKIVTYGKRTCIDMISNPYMEHSDSDGIPDGEEFERGTDPLFDDTQYEAYVGMKWLRFGDDFYSKNADELFNEPGLYMANNGIGLFLGVTDRERIYRELLVDYYTKYTDDITLEKAAFEAQRKSMIEDVQSMMKAGHANGYDQLSLFVCANQMISHLNGCHSTSEMNNFIVEKCVQQAKSFYVEWQNLRKMNAMANGSRYVTKQWTGAKAAVVAKFADRGLNALNKLTVAVVAIDSITDFMQMYKNYGLISANEECFIANMDGLESIINDEFVEKELRNAALSIQSKLAEEYFTMKSDIIDNVGACFIENGYNAAMTLLASYNTVALVLLIIKDGLKVFGGCSEDIKQIMRMGCYNSMVRAYGNLADANLPKKVESEVYYEKTVEYYSYVTNMVQLRILGEIEYYNWYKNEGLCGDWLVDKVSGLESVRDEVNQSISIIKNVSDSLGLTLSNSICYSVE